MNLKAGERIYLSMIGHKGFIYPTTRWVSLVSPVIVERLCWVGGGDKVAVKLPELTHVHDWLDTFQIEGPVWICRG